MKKIKILLPVMAMLAVGVAGFTGSEAKVANAAEPGTYQLVTDASTLKAGDKLLLGADDTKKGDFVAGNISSQYMASISATIENGNIANAPTNAVVLTLGGSSGAWTFTNSSGKLLGATNVKKVAWGSGTTKWSISIATNGDATIQNGTSTYGRFLYNVGSPRFTTYTSGTQSDMVLPKLYALVADTEEEPSTSYTATFDATPAKFVNSADSSMTVEAEEATVTLPTADKLANNGLFYAGTAHVTGWKGADGTTYALGATVSISGNTSFTAIHQQDKSEITAAEATTIAKETGTTASLYQYTVSGTVTAITNAYNSDYKSVGVTIKDVNGDTINAYGMKSADSYDISKLREGANVTVTGNLINYKDTTPQFNTNCTAVVHLDDIDAPENLAYDNDTYTLSWDEVTGADSYSLVITGSEGEVVNEVLTETTYDATELDNGTFTASIKALGDPTHKDSEATTYEFTKVAPAKDLLAAVETRSSLAIGWTTNDSGECSHALKPNGTAAGNNHYGQKDKDVTSEFEGSEGFTVSAESNGTNIWVSATDVRLYRNNGKGTKYTFTSKDGQIKSIKLTFASGYSAPCDYFVDDVNMGKVTITNNVATFDVNGSSFAIQNVSTNADGDNNTYKQVRITGIEIVTGGVGYEVTNAVVRFGAFIDKAEIWDKLENVSGYGVAVATRSTVDNLAGDSLTEVLEVYADEKETLLANKVGFAEGDMENITTQDGSVFFNARLEVPAEEYSTEICAVAYVIVDGEYVFLQEKVSSVVAEAEYYLTQHNSGDEELDADVVGALRSLVA